MAPSTPDAARGSVPRNEAGELAERLPHFRFPTDAAGWGVVVVSAVAGLVSGGLAMNGVSRLLTTFLG